jgi:phosphonate transport system substrate-binding protein
MFGEGVGKERKIIANLSHVTGDGSYSAMIPQLIAGGCDVTVSFADYRYNADANAYFEEAYKDEIAAGKYTSIYDIIKVIGVSDYIMNDTISVASEKVDPKMTPEFVKALQEAFMEIGSTPEGLACVQPYSHMGYRIGQDSDYDSSRAAAEILKNK